jgi:3-dehydroquinate synthase
VKRSTRTKPELLGRTAGTVTPVFLRASLGYDLGAVLLAPKNGQRISLVTDSIVWQLHGRKVSRGLAEGGWKVDILKLAPGERIKSSRVIAQLHDQWFKHGYDRSNPVVALGGGTVGDGVGFAAATFLRGLPLWHVPTTIIGQVDSSIGGKVGINHVRGKNLIGCFYQPTGVVIDVDFLSTLPIREIRSGLAEVVKYGIISDPTLFGHCEKKVPSWITNTSPLDPSTLKTCAAIKLKVVASDERDTGKRHILNFGHTLGHAYEAWGRFKTFKHGEAVTLGMVSASRIAERRQLITRRDFDRILALCALIALSRKTVRFDADDVIPYLASDKKRTLGQNAWVLPVGIGRVRIVRDVADKEIRDAIEFVRKWMLKSE